MPKINPYAILFPSTVTLALIIVACAWPAGRVQVTLFWVALIVAVVLATVSIFVGAAIIHGLREDNAALVARLQDTNDRLGRLERKVGGYMLKAPIPSSIKSTWPNPTRPRSA